MSQKSFHSLCSVARKSIFNARNDSSQWCPVNLGFDQISLFPSLHIRDTSRWRGATCVFPCALPAGRRSRRPARPAETSFPSSGPRVAELSWLWRPGCPSASTPPAGLVRPASTPPSPSSLPGDCLERDQGGSVGWWWRSSPPCRLKRWPLVVCGHLSLEMWLLQPSFRFRCILVSHRGNSPARPQCAARRRQSSCDALPSDASPLSASGAPRPLAPLPSGQRSLCARLRAEVIGTGTPLALAFVCVLEL